jgi:ADP-ribose pyrophosphatase
VHHCRMQKPKWRRRSSSYLVDSPFMRLRVDEVELPDGTVVPNYYVRESRGYVVVFPLTDDGRIVLVRQYRYGSDTIHLELPAGVLDGDEEPVACAARELAEETGYEVAEWHFVGDWYIEPVRSQGKAYVFYGTGARKAREPTPDPTEALQVELATIDDFRAMLSDGRIDTGFVVGAGYRVLDYLGRL